MPQHEHNQTDIGELARYLKSFPAGSVDKPVQKVATENTEIPFVESMSEMAITDKEIREEITKRFEMIPEHAVFIHLVSEPRPRDIFLEANHVMALPDELKLALYRKVFPIPIAFTAEKVMKNKTTISDRIPLHVDFADSVGNPLRLALYCSMGGELICWENYQDMMYARHIFMKYRIFRYTKGYISGTHHQMMHAGAAGFSSKNQGKGYEMWQQFEYYTLY